MLVRIIDKRTGQLAAEIPVVVAGANYQPTEQEYFKEAWKCAVDDKSVDSAREADYMFQLGLEGG